MAGVVTKDLMAAVEWAKGDREQDEHVEAGFFAIAETMNIFRDVHTKKKGKP